MGLIGGELAFRFLTRFFPAGNDPSDDYCAVQGVDKLSACFGPGIFDELRDKTVIDFGCGGGENAINLALRGCRDVIGLEIQESLLDAARREARNKGVSDRCRFGSEWTDQVDVVISTDAFEHFDDPAQILRLMRSLIRDDGYALVEFGYTWFHPLGGHLFSVFPWAHLIFTEETLIRWRNTFRSDGATRFREVAGGLNQMTLRRWETLVEQSDFQFAEYTLVPIRAVRPLHNRFTREFFTSTIRARLIPKGPQAPRYGGAGANLE